MMDDLNKKMTRKYPFDNESLIFSKKSDKKWEVYVDENDIS